MTATRNPPGSSASPVGFRPTASSSMTVPAATFTSDKVCEVWLAVTSQFSSGLNTRSTGDRSGASAETGPPLVVTFGSPAVIRPCAAAQTAQQSMLIDFRIIRRCPSFEKGCTELSMADFSPLRREKIALLIRRVTSYPRHPGTGRRAYFIQPLA